VGKYYGTYDAQKIFDEFAPEELGITPLFFENTFYCKKCGGIVSSKTCPHGDEDHVTFSGTEVRRRLEVGEPLPPEFTRPGVYKVLVEGMRAKRSGEGQEILPAPPSRVESERQGDKAMERMWGGRKVVVIGLDCAEPSLVFDRWREELPNLNRLMSGGVYGRLESCIPAITVPAWSVMTSSKDPGQLGIYGFRNRADYSYDKMTIATGSAVKEDRVWDILSRAGKQVVTVGVPGTYPPRPVNGVMVGCFLTPSAKSQYTYPPEVKDQIASWVGEYQVDVPQFRTEDKDFLLKQIYDMTDQHFVVVEKLLTEKPWDFFMFVEMGTDRIHHGMWKYTDPAHPKYEPGNKWQDSIRDYYKKLDSYIGHVLSLVPQDTVVLVVSDHGAKTMHGGVAVNEWLIRNGWLALKDEPPQKVTPFEKVEVDWSKTRAWGSGGYYGRVFLNVAGREPQGVIPHADYERVRDELAKALEAIPAPDGRAIGTVAFKPEQVYQEVKNVPPDLIVYFGNLDWRAVGSLGLGDIYTFENDTGPDDANHAQHGMFILYDPTQNAGGRRMDAQIMDIAPTVLNLMGLPVPRDMNGKIIKA
jgi:predicted AlkP superfamily phosphohydrolase/phosphomutase